MNKEIEDVFKNLEIEKKKLEEQQNKVNELEKLVYSSYQEVKERLIKLVDEFIAKPCQDTFFPIVNKLDFSNFSFWVDDSNFRLEKDNIVISDEIFIVSGKTFYVEFNLEEIKTARISNYENCFFFVFINDLATLKFTGKIRKEFYKIDCAKKYNLGASK